MTLEEIATPILSRIGFDFARIGELETADVAELWGAHETTNAAMLNILIAQVGDADVAKRMLEFARRLPEAKQAVHRERFAQAMERDERPAPHLLAAHLIFSVDIATALAVELQRRASPVN